MENKKFVIIDAMALAYKAYFAFISRPLVSKKGEPTSAVYGFVTQILKVIEDQKPDYMAVAFDSKEKTFRHDIYKDYKVSREKMPDDMIRQIGRIKDIIEALNMPLYILPKYEADDIIGTAVKIAEKKGLLSYVITPDKDYNQMITKKTFIVRGEKSTDEIKIYDEKMMMDEFGFTPKQMIDYLALVGDKSDDIPGVAGIGPKGATELIKEFKTLENIYKNIDKVKKEGTKNKLIESKKNAFLSKELATINCSVPMEFNFEKAKFTSPDFDKIKEIFVDLEFTRLYQRLLNIFDKNSEEVAEVVNDQKVFDNKKVKYKLVNNVEEAEKLAEVLSKSKLFVFDTETDGLNYLDLNLAGVSFSSKKGEGFFVALQPEKNKKDLFSKNLDDRIPTNEFVKIFTPLFKNSKIKKVCQNGKYDIGVLRSLGIEVNNFFFDTMVASYIIDPDQKHGMDALSEKYLNYKPISISSIIGEKKDPTKIFDVDLNELNNYSSEDADITFRLYEILSKEIKKEGLEKIAYDIDFPLVAVLEDIEREGITVDKKTLNDLSKELEKLIEKLTRKIYKYAGSEFNINSPKQLQEILFNKLGLTPTKKTKTGFSTDARSLENMRGQHEIIDELSEYRQITKLKSTYADALPNMINPKTGRIHTTLNQIAASTGRLSSNDPNLQNIPIRTERGKEIRRAFVPRDKNHIILSADYSQIELRIMASICDDEGMKKAFKNSEDIHKSTAALVFMVDPEDVTSDMRRKAKEVNFGILYGIGPFGLSTRLGITQKHAKEIIETYFNTFKKVKNYMEDTVKVAKEKGYAETLLGRRRFLRNINSKNRIVRQFEERVAINMPIQGTAADMIKIAMINIHKELTKRKAKTKMILQVHDELLFDAHKDEIDELRPVIKKLMETALPMEVPILVETGIGENWLDAH
ncbi:MAG: DNA polymerase I [Ignavibacteriales bacterium CG12_big_fil_rev_8_21_14_0_65_30_8]|nr:MAG: DNA polymerase I [Ignavibacteriales bacterium CG12_big_fil_rev_8_21_14_0_65_30_8]